jgi:hypothetical protein
VPVDQSKIPLLSPGGFLVGVFSAQELKLMKGVDLRINKRGNITSAHTKPLTCHIVKLNLNARKYGVIPKGGEDPRPNEALPNGLRCWAFGGVDC